MVFWFRCNFALSSYDKILIQQEFCHSLMRNGGTVVGQCLYNYFQSVPVASGWTLSHNNCSWWYFVIFPICSERTRTRMRTNARKGDTLMKWFVMTVLSLLFLSISLFIYFHSICLCQLSTRGSIYNFCGVQCFNALFNDFYSHDGRTRINSPNNVK